MEQREKRRTCSCARLPVRRCYACSADSPIVLTHTPFSRTRVSLCAKDTVAAAALVSPSPVDSYSVPLFHYPRAVLGKMMRHYLHLICVLYCFDCEVVSRTTQTERHDCHLLLTLTDCSSCCFACACGCECIVRVTVIAMIVCLVSCVLAEKRYPL